MLSINYTCLKLERSILKKKTRFLAPSPVLFPLYYVCSTTSDRDPSVPCSDIHSHGMWTGPSDLLLKNRILQIDGMSLH